jgi:hypothetical protein
VHFVFSNYTRNGETIYLLIIYVKKICRSVIFRWLRHERSGKCFLTHCWGPDEIRVLQGGAG